MSVIIDLTSPSKSTAGNTYDDLKNSNDANDGGKSNTINLLSHDDEFGTKVSKRQIGEGFQQNTKKNGNNNSYDDISKLYLNSFRKKNDNADVTEGLIELIEDLDIANLATCFGSHSMAARPCTCCEDLPPYLPRRQLFHIMQKDKWSCGFRNTQMALSSLLPHLSRQHLRLIQNKNDQQCHDEKQPQLNHQSPTINSKRKRAFNNMHNDDNTIYYGEIPSLRQLQIYLERCWNEGFDLKGAQHYNFKILDTNSFIGAVEVSSIFAYLNIDSTVIQFILCPQSRSLLGPFVWAYFTNQAVDLKCNSKHCSSKTIASQLLHIVTSNRNQTNFDSNSTRAQQLKTDMKHEIEDGQNQKNCCTCPLMPLYLQWEGHSVTIIGIQRYTGFTSEFVYDLLVFDPMKCGATIKESIGSQVAKKKSIETQALYKNCNNSNNLAEKCNFASSSSSENGRCLSKMRLPVKKLSKKDCQIVLCSTRQLSYDERENAKETTNALTAANESVAKSLKSNGYK